MLCESDIPTCRDDQILIASRAEGSCCLADICSQFKKTDHINFSVLWHNIRELFKVVGAVTKVCFHAVCAPCVETPPLCQDGEILTVDSNTTDRCCPTYHCGQSTSAFTHTLTSVALANS